MITKTDRAGIGLNKVGIRLKRIVAVCIAIVCVIGCMQTGIVTAKAEDEESEMDFVKESLKECMQSLDKDDPRGSSDIQTYLMHWVCYDCDYTTPGDHYYPDRALLVHVDENKLISAYASDGVNKWPIEYSFEDDKGNNIGWTTDGVNINIVKHSDADYADYYDIDTKKPAHTIYMNYDLSVAPTPDIPAPPVSEKVAWDTDPGSFTYEYDAFNYGYVSGKYTTYISSGDNDMGNMGFDEETTNINVVIRSTKITSISKKAFPAGDIKEIKKVKIYLPEEKFKAYKTMLLKVPSIKKVNKAGKVKFYTLNKWNGKILARSGSDITFATEPDYVYGATQATTRGEWYDENVIASREDSLKNTNVKKGSKIYKELVGYGEYSYNIGAIHQS